MKAFAHDVYTYPLPPGPSLPPSGKYKLVREGAEASGEIAVGDARAAATRSSGSLTSDDYLDRVRRGDLTRREELALGLPGRPRSWNAHDGPSARRSRPRARRWRTESPPTSAAAPTTPLPTVAAASASSTTSSSRRARFAVRPGSARADRRPRRPPGRRNARRLPGRCRGVHVLGERLPQLPVQARARRPRARPPGRDRRRGATSTASDGSCPRPSRGRAPSSASTSPAPIPTGATGWAAR